MARKFAEGDASEWLRRFDICSEANEWDEGMKVRKLSTLLEGKALVSWLELSEAEQSDYEMAKNKCSKNEAHEICST